jgi:hypothetical protein
LDLALGEATVSGISILTGNGDGTFRDLADYRFASPGGIALVAGDFNGDGRLDVDNSCSLLQVPLAVTISRTQLTFPKQKIGTTSTPKQIRLANSGTHSVAITSIGTSGDFIQTNTCPATLDIFKACVLSVSFSPTAIGTRNGSLTIVDNASGSPQVVSLSGIGTN